MEQNPKPTRRGFRFSLRTMFVVMTLVAVTAFAFAQYWWGPTRQFRQLCIKRQAELHSAHDSLRTAIEQGQYSRAYAMTTPKFQKLWKGPANLKNFGLTAVKSKDDAFMHGNINNGMVFERPPQDPDNASAVSYWVWVEGRWLLDEHYGITR